MSETPDSRVMSVDPAAVRDAPTHRGDRLAVFGPGQPRLLVFVPAAFTPVCTCEVNDLVALAPSAAAAGVQICVVSCDTPATLRAWLSTVDATGQLLGVSDHWPHGALARAMDAFDAVSGTARRVTVAVTRTGERIHITESAPGIARNRGEHARGLRVAAGE